MSRSNPSTGTTSKLSRNAGGRVSLYPHTEQLPLLLRALNLEFYGALPDRIARVVVRWRAAGDGGSHLVQPDNGLCNVMSSVVKR